MNEQTLVPPGRAAAWLLALLVSAPAATAQDLDLVFKTHFEDAAATALCAGAPAISGSADGALDPPGQTDVYAYAGTAGEWLALQVTANPDRLLERLDSVVTLYSADGRTQLARNDDDPFSLALDSLVVYRVDTTGTYCIAVEDFTTSRGLPPPDGATFDYALAAVPLALPSAGRVRDTEPNDTAGSATIGTTSAGPAGETAFVVGDFGAAADVDIFRFTTATLAEVVEVRFGPQGVAGWGGSTGLNLVDVLEPDGTTVLARLDVALGARAIRVPVIGQRQYRLAIRTPTTPLGAKPTYTVRWATMPDDTQAESNDVGNGLAATAEVAAPVAGSSGMSYFFRGTLSAGDEDYWAFPASAGERIRVYCASKREGSGVTDPTFRLYGDPVQAPLRSEVETATADLGWHNDGGASRPAVTAPSSRTDYMRVGASTLSPVVTDRHYGCGVHVDAVGTY